VITVSDGINEPRLPAMRGIMMAKKKKINVMDLAGLGTSFEDVGGGAPASGIVEFMPTEKRKGGQKFEGEPAEVTAKVVDLLVNEAKVL
jgi:electron transfer flavoprotein beta subunit